MAKKMCDKQDGDMRTRFVETVTWNNRLDHLFFPIL